MVITNQVNQTSLHQAKPGKMYTAYIIVVLGVLLFAAGVFLYKSNTLYKSGLFGQGQLCGGWNTGGEVICKCSGKLIKPDCPTGARCDATSYKCYGQCGNCCFKGVVEQNQYPNCVDLPTSSGNSVVGEGDLL